MIGAHAIAKGAAAPLHVIISDRASGSRGTLGVVPLFWFMGVGRLDAVSCGGRTVCPIWKECRRGEGEGGKRDRLAKG